MREGASCCMRDMDVADWDVLDKGVAAYLKSAYSLDATGGIRLRAPGCRQLLLCSSWSHLWAPSQLNACMSLLLAPASCDAFYSLFWTCVSCAVRRWVAPLPAPAALSR